MALERVFSPLF